MYFAHFLWLDISGLYAVQKQHMRIMLRLEGKQLVLIQHTVYQILDLCDYTAFT